jgi:ABC-type polysaccharide/polyol phosphate transport system ATPase subunit
MTSAVQFLGVSKRFILHHQRSRTLRETVLSRFERGRDTSREELWALRDVTFDVAPGDCLGIIGANGSGKSTALKLMTRILEPTSGQVQVRGRVSALLELGAGFHPDLTGRENIYLNGSILGIGRRSMQKRLDEIVAFAELERFIDMPVKHYSSGMYMRLGFAIAINVDPDVLLTDEVLAVGDQSFQTKCMERIGEMKQAGVTIVFVSHSLDSVRSLCNKSVWLDHGHVTASGESHEVIDAYLASVAEKDEARLAAEAAVAEGQVGRWGSGEAAITGVTFFNAAGKEAHVFFTGQPMRVRISYRVTGRIEEPMIGVAIYRSDGVHVSGPNSRFSGYDIPYIAGEGTIDYVVKSLALLEGSYDFSAAIYDREGVHPYDHQHRAFKFLVQRGRVKESYGLVYMPSHWEHHSPSPSLGSPLATLGNALPAMEDRSGETRPG